MKRDNIIYAIGALIIFISALMKIFHIQGAQIAELVSVASVAFIVVYMGIQRRKLKQKVEEIEN